MVTCFLNQSDDETLGPWIPVSGYANVAFYISGSGTTSSGVISIEEAAPLFPSGPVFGAATGGYSVITTVNASDVTGGLQKAVHIGPTAAAFVRSRISTAIGGGGTVTAVMVAS